jgi:hypothetical protein
MPTLRWGSSGDEVAKLQETLQHLGFYHGTIDGRFGALTRAAVIAFQQQAGLDPDGVVGPATWAVLADEQPVPSGGTPGAQTGNGQPPKSAPTGQARSLHIALNSVNPASYGGWNGALSGCENDARTMMRIAQSDGLTTRQLFTVQATTDNVIAEIEDAARELGAGGLFLLTYAGHGGQVADVSGDGETDRQDETWVLYNRQFLDDEIEQALAAFAPGVRIVMLSDSCHSGTVHRSLPEDQHRALAEMKRSFYTDLVVARPGPDDDESLSFPQPAAAVAARQSRAARRTSRDFRPAVRYPGQQPRIPGQLARGGVAVLDRPFTEQDATEMVTTREMPFAINQMANQLQADELREAKAEAGSARALVRASGLLISGCQDNQLSQESGGHGVFTTAVERTWAGSSFAGDYTAFHQAVRSRMGPTQQPELSLFGQDPHQIAGRTPFNP